MSVRQPCVGVNAVARIDQPAVDAAGQRRLGQAGADRGRDLGHCHWRGELAFGAIRQLDRVIDLNFYPIDSTARSNEKWRPVALITSPLRGLPG